MSVIAAAVSSWIQARTRFSIFTVILLGGFFFSVSKFSAQCSTPGDSPDH